jgi:hypothetical protein
VALKGIEGGFRQCFRLLPADLSTHRDLCETYDFLRVDVLGGEYIDDIFTDLKSGRDDFELEHKRYRKVRGNKTKARDTAFKLLYLILLGEFKNEEKDSNKIFNAVLFVVSHPNTFKSKTREVVRAAYNDRFIATTKQIAELNKWKRGDAVGQGAEEDDKTTEEESSDDYGSDCSF